MSVGRHIINLVLTFLHAVYIIIQRNILIGRVRLCGCKTQQFANLFLIGKIFTRTFFQHLTELIPESLVFFRIILGHFFQHAQDLFN